ncbi:MAG: Rrf2 family transcriptional regulator [Planctomycetota bacterium]|nr:MAG: Rrf2 family transcriptional regulator [Planctomycetota bacterium]REJ96462.1 MAG: Rrf2 family transcriptional regulator [Planctomycetota bacterium]REK25106.1 MAG: Rrf2 family transcriptional regulator [Planctomycetota bacterium]REK44674.1 MAG: Rrf2 family transcriptional regulator [Planctomycetota bacterium]
MISQTAEYALRAIVYLADNEGDPRTTVQIAGATDVPAGYLSKVMQNLSRAKLVIAQRGMHGGFTLAKEASKLTILEIVNAVDPVLRIHECPLRIAAHGKNLCPLHRRLDDAAAMVEKAFADTTIDELLAVPRSRKPLCRFPCEPVSK